MSWTDPVFDRTITDIETLTDKAFFNIADWIRINGNTEYVRALVNVLRGLNISYNSVSEPSVTTFPTAAQLNAFIENIENIRSVSGLPPASGIVALKTDYEALTGAEVPNYETVNDWERDLQLLKDFTISISTYMVFSGVAVSGQIRFWQARFRTIFVRESVSPVLRARSGICVTGSGLKMQNKFRRYD